MDFVSDALGDGRKCRALTIVDDVTRECPAIEVDRSWSGERVARVLESSQGSRCRTPSPRASMGGCAMNA
jgi:putative transposase